MNFKSGIRQKLIATIFGVVISACAAAQNFPTKPIRVIVPYSPGGTTDIVARIVAQRAEQLLGQPMIVENRTGGGTIAGTRAVLQAPADGYTVLVGGPTLLILPLLSEFADYRVSDFAPVAGLTTLPYAFSTTRSLPVTTLAEFIAYGKANPGKLNLGTIGAVGTSKLLAERFASQAGIEFTDVPYKGAAPILADISAGRVHLYADGAPSSIALHKQQRVRVLAVSAEERMSEAPDIPTFKELGFPDMTSSTWMAFLVRSETPDAATRRIGAEIMKAMNDPVVRDRIAALGASPWLGTPADFAAYAKKDIQAWQDDIKRRNTKR